MAETRGGTFKQRVFPYVPLQSSHDIPPPARQEQSLVDSRRMHSLTPLQQLMVEKGVIDPKGRMFGGLYGVEDLAVDVATGPLPVGMLGSVGRKFPFLKRLFGIADDAPDILRTRPRGEFHVYPPHSEADIESARRYINRLMDSLDAPGKGLSSPETRGIEQLQKQLQELGSKYNRKRLD